MTKDFTRFLAEYGLTDVPESVRQAYQSEGDQIGFPCPVMVAVRRSRIEGLGVFATTTFEPGTVIAPMRIGTSRTPAGRYTNHSGSPNASVLKAGQSAFLKAARKILADEEITIDYREAIACATS